MKLYSSAPQYLEARLHMTEVPVYILCRVMFNVLFFGIKLKFFQMCFQPLGLRDYNTENLVAVMNIATGPLCPICTQI